MNGARAGARRFAPTSAARHAREGCAAHAAWAARRAHDVETVVDEKWYARSARGGQNLRGMRDDARGRPLVAQLQAAHAARERVERRAHDAAARLAQRVVGDRVDGQRAAHGLASERRPVRGAGGGRRRAAPRMRAVRVVERAVRAVAEPRARARGERARQIRLRAEHRVAHGRAAREVRGDGRRERAAGAVRVGRGDAQRVQRLVRAPVVEHVDRRRAVGKMAALDEHVRTAERMQPLGGGTHLLDGADRARLHPKHLLRLGQVWRQHGRERREPSAERAHRIVAHERTA